MLPNNYWCCCGGGCEIGIHHLCTIFALVVTSVTGSICLVVVSAGYLFGWDKSGYPCVYWLWCWRLHCGLAFFLCLCSLGFAVATRWPIDDCTGKNKCLLSRETVSSNTSYLICWCYTEYLLPGNSFMCMSLRLFS